MRPETVTRARRSCLLPGTAVGPSYSRGLFLDSPRSAGFLCSLFERFCCTHQHKKALKAGLAALERRRDEAPYGERTR